MKTSLNRIRRPATAVVDRRAMTAADERHEEQLQVCLDWATRAQIVCMLAPYPVHDSNSRCSLQTSLSSLRVMDRDHYEVQAALSRQLTLAYFRSVARQGIIDRDPPTFNFLFFSRMDHSLRAMIFI